MKLIAPVVVWLLAPVLAWGQSATTVHDTSATSGSESLGDQLLEDLPATVPPAGPQARQNGTSPADTSPGHPMPTTEDAGEDIGGASGPLLLARVRNDMRRAEALLGGPATVPHSAPLRQAGKVQQRIVAQLDELIAELCRQCQGGQGQKSNHPSPQPSQRSEVRPKKSSRTASPGKSPARDSSDPLNRAGAQAVDKGDVDELVRHLWGHLPERSREQVLQSFSDEFLPKYEQEIEKYYRRLSEEQQESQVQ
jgi:hypothetical protein